jgi:hypothetical protein
VPVDLPDMASLRTAVGELRPTHVFRAAWLHQPTKDEVFRSILTSK